MIKISIIIMIIIIINNNKNKLYINIYNIKQYIENVKKTIR